MKLYLNTRGATLDYRFLADFPKDSWWRRYDPFTRFESPTLIVEAHAAGWRFYLSGVPSARLDRSKRVIRYTIIADGTGGEQSEILLRLAQAWLEDQNTHGVAERIRAALDEEFPEKEVEDLLSQQHVEGLEDRVRAALSELRVELPEEGASASPEEGWGLDSWWGSLKVPTARRDFFERIRSILSGKHAGRAAFLNLIDTKKEALEALGQEPTKPTPIWILVNSVVAEQEMECLEWVSPVEQDVNQKKTSAPAVLGTILLALITAGAITMLTQKTCKDKATTINTHTERSSK